MKGIRLPAGRLPLAAAISVSLGGALWALLGHSCPSCGQAAALTGGLNLAAIGVGFYALLLLAALFTGVSAPVSVLVLAAGSAHLALTAILAGHRIVCHPCLLTAAGALCASAVALWREPANFRRAVPILVAAILSTNGAMALLGKRSRDKILVTAREAARQALGAKVPVAAGDALMYVYLVDGCPACVKFKTEVQPVVEKEYGERLTVLQSHGPKGLATPTAVVIGARSAVLLPPVPTLDDIRRALRNVSRPDDPGPAPRNGIPMAKEPAPAAR